MGMERGMSWNAGAQHGRRACAGPREGLQQGPLLQDLHKYWSTYLLWANS